jgi:glycosyltransferase involved in cell wall biosynthesis
MSRDQALTSAPARAAGAKSAEEDRDAKISIAFVNSIFVKRDAISNTLFDRVQYAARHRNEFDYKVYCYASDYPRFNVEIVHNPGHIVRTPGFLNADIVVVEFGIYHDLFDVVLCDTGAPKLVSYHNVTSSSLFEPGTKRELCERSELQGWNLRFADFVVCNSGFTRTEAIGYGVDPARTAVIAPSVPLIRRPEIFKAADGPVTMLCVGRIVPQKGLLDLIRALDLLSRTDLPPWRLDVVGTMKFSDPVYIRQLRDAIARSGFDDRVRFLGELDEEALSRAFAEAHVVVSPSHHEGFGVPVIEGLATGCVIVCSDAGSLPEVAGEFGHVFKCGDSDELARALMYVLMDMRPYKGPPKYRVGARILGEREYYEAAASYVRPFLPDAAVEAFYGVVRRMVADRKASACNETKKN